MKRYGLSSWKNGLHAYWVRGMLYVSLGVILAALAGFAAVRWTGYEEVRHTFSKVAATGILANLTMALRRRRWLIRIGAQHLWLKGHWAIGGFALTLIAFHSRLQPETWSGRLVFSLAALLFVSGLTTHFTVRKVRYVAVRIHLIAGILLVAAFLVHGAVKLRESDEKRVVTVNCDSNPTAGTATVPRL